MTQPSLFDAPVHRDAGKTERAAAVKTQCVSEQRRQAILAEARWRKRWGITRAEADVLLETTPNVTQPRLHELGGYGKHERLMVQTKQVRDGCHIWVAVEYATVEERAA
jgi:hypothetical protein